MFQIFLNKIKSNLNLHRMEKKWILYIWRLTGKEKRMSQGSEAGKEKKILLAELKKV